MVGCSDDRSTIFALYPVCSFVRGSFEKTKLASFHNGRQRFSEPAQKSARYDVPTANSQNGRSLGGHRYGIEIYETKPIFDGRIKKKTCEIPKARSLMSLARVRGRGIWRHVRGR